MAYLIPPWIQPVNPVPSFERGVSTGADIASQQNRLELAIQEMTLRREAQQRHDEAQNLAAVRTVQDIQAQQQEMQEKARQAALKWQWNQELTGRIKAGEDPLKAWEATAPMYNPQGYAQYAGRKEALAQSAALHQASATAQQARFEENKKLREAEFEERKRHDREIEGKPTFEERVQKDTWLKDYNATRTAYAKAKAALDAYDRSPSRRFDKDIQTPGSLNPRDAMAAEEASLRQDMERQKKIGQQHQWYLPDEETAAPPVEPSRFGESKSLDAAMAKVFLRQANGDKAKARKLAREAGYTF